ncbi:MAG: hypothetical protein QHH06_00050 [Clostridiales bacterium]|jgi:hypothetical protein|nr:hypothetical protein [Eubacteriales bacterium]MDH7564861.1 hypothetical protein [Clostridiales bacterium]
MIFIVTALHCEAKPIIRHFKLKKDARSTRFDLYSNGEIYLIVCGTGILRCAVATAHILSIIPHKNGASALNTGICGAVSPDIEEGTPLLFHKIIHSETGREYYPDILLKHGLREVALNSFASPVTKEYAGTHAFEFADMEAAGFMEAASMFLPAHAIFCLKVVSDHLEGTRMEPEFVTQLMQKNLEHIEHIVVSSRELPGCRERELLTSSDYRVLELIGERLRLTATMRHQLKETARLYKIRHKNSLEGLEAFLNLPVDSKKEGKIVFERIKQYLIH